MNLAYYGMTLWIDNALIDINICTLSLRFTNPFLFMPITSYIESQWNIDYGSTM